MAVAELLETLATVSKVLGSIPGEVTKILLKRWCLASTVNQRLGDIPSVQLRCGDRPSCDAAT